MLKTCPPFGAHTEPSSKIRNEMQLELILSLLIDVHYFTILYGHLYFIATLVYYSSRILYARCKMPSSSRLRLSAQEAQRLRSGTVQT